MSETDDTDVLLLIPPNFFLVKSSGSEESLLDSSRTVVHKPTSCTAQILGKLVTSVHCLETRLDSLEISTESVTSFGTLPRRKYSDTDSLDSKSVDGKSFTFPRRRQRKLSKKRDRSRDLSITSYDSAGSYAKVPPLKFELASLSSKRSETLNESPSMDGDISSIVSSPNKNNDKLLLHEIDEFLTKVESYESPESKYQVNDTLISPENVIKAAGDYITQKYDTNYPIRDVRLPSGRIIPSNILDKYIYLVKCGSNSQSEKSSPIVKPKPRTDINNPGHSEPSKPVLELTKMAPEPKSPSIRRLNFTETKDIQPTSTPKKPANTNYLDNFRPSSNKIYDRASKVLEQYKSQNQSNSVQNTTDSYSLPKEDFKMPQMRPYPVPNKEAIRMTAKYIDSIDTDLLSLSDLWGEKAEKADKGESDKLEEERLKREHCESMIQQLQKKLLEQQEKLAVAVKVDHAKDAAISKLKDAWVRLTSSLDRAEDRHRAALDKMVQEVENFKLVADDAQKKTSHFEKELYKTLDLAHDYQEKCKQYCKDKEELEERTQKVLADKDEVVLSKNKEIEVLKDNYETVLRLNKQSTDCIKNLEEALIKEKSDHDSTKSQCSDLTSKMQSVNDQTSLICQERDLVKGKLGEERARCSMMERQLVEEKDSYMELMRRHESLETEAKTLRKLLEVQKEELKSHYQKQLEEAVLSKLQEFQHQLDAAEREMERDSREKENAIVDAFNKQINRIEEQHRLEVNVLEEKQKEEIKLYRLQLAQAHEKIGLLDSKLESYRRRRGDLARQLHGVMQTQWRQALNILTSGKHVAGGVGDVTADSVLSTPVAQDYAPPKIPPLGMPPHMDANSHKPDYNFQALSDSQLQQYVKLLLTKPPNLDASGDNSNDLLKDIDEEPTSDRPDRHDRRDKNKRHLNTSKPPWKA